MKPSAEMQFLYGNHVLKSGLGRITEGTPGYTGVVVYSMSGEAPGAGVLCVRLAMCLSQSFECPIVRVGGRVGGRAGRCAPP